jgi:F-type H+-transporting ATPase subunit delta
MHEYLDRRYALALYEVADKKGKAKDYIDTLGEILGIINENVDFIEIIRHPHLSTSKKKEMFENIFKGRVEEDILSFLLILIEKDRILTLQSILEEMKKIHLERNHTLAAFVKTVVPLLEEERTALIQKLQAMYSKNIILNEEIDTDIIGGVFVRVGNDVIDGTIKAKFDQIRKLTLKTE